MIRAVIIGFAHMHVNEVTEYIKNAEQMELVGMADIPPFTKELTDATYTRTWNLKNNSKKFNMKPYDDYKQMLDELKPDIAFILCENVRKVEVVKACAERGVNVSIEKPMALNLQEAKEIREIVKKTGIEAVINWPLTWRPYYHKQIAALKSGIIGDLVKCFFVIGMTGPLGMGAKHRGVMTPIEDITDEQRASTWWYKGEYGGGAFLDMGCYGCMVNTWIRENDDLPTSVMAHAGNYSTPYMNAPDNVAIIVEYKNSYGIIEGSWAVPQITLPTGPVFLGTKGVLYCDAERNVKAVNMRGDEIELPEYEITPHIENLPDHYGYCKANNIPLHKTLTLDWNIQVIALLDAAMKSSISKQREEVERVL